MVDAVHIHCTRPWWKRPPVWFIGIAVVFGLVVWVAIEGAGKRTSMPYGAFLDQLAAGNVTSVTFRGTEIDARLKRPVESMPASDDGPRDTVRSRVPDFGDPTLIADLRKQQVAIDVVSPSQWTSWLSRLPLPMLFIIGAILIAGLVRLVRGGKPVSVSPMSMHPMGGMVGLVSSFFTKRDQPVGPAEPKSEEPKAL